VRKSPFRTVELVRREAQVKEGPIDPLDAHPIEDPGEVAKVAPGDDHSIAKSFEPRLCSCERLRITVDPQESSMGTHPLQQCLGVSPAPRRTIDGRTASFGRKVVNHRFEQHRLMRKHPHPSSLPKCRGRQSSPHSPRRIEMRSPYTI